MSERASARASAPHSKNRPNFVSPAAPHARSRSLSGSTGGTERDTHSASPHSAHAPGAGRLPPPAVAPALVSNAAACRRRAAGGGCARSRRPPVGRLRHGPVRPGACPDWRKCRAAGQGASLWRAPRCAAAPVGDGRRRPARQDCLPRPPCPAGASCAAADGDHTAAAFHAPLHAEALLRRVRHRPPRPQPGRARLLPRP